VSASPSKPEALSGVEQLQHTLEETRQQLATLEKNQQDLRRDLGEMRASPPGPAGPTHLTLRYAAVTAAVTAPEPDRTVPEPADPVADPVAGPITDPNADPVVAPIIAQAPHVPERAYPQFVQEWNEEFPKRGLEPFRRMLPPGWQVSSELKHLYFLVYRDSPEHRGQPMHLLPFLGKDVSLFTIDFFDGPTTGAAEQLLETAKVSFREQNTTPQQELDKLMHPNISLAQVLSLSEKGQIA
jgi:hypothetical protein